MAIHTKWKNIRITLASIQIGKDAKYADMKKVENIHIIFVSILIGRVLDREKGDGTMIMTRNLSLRKSLLAGASVLFLHPAMAQTPSWTTPKQIGSGLFYGMAADNDTTIVCSGNGSITCQRSVNEGETWEPPVSIGRGSEFLDRPLYVDGQNVYVTYFKKSRTTTDWCCSREMGNIYLRPSYDKGKTWLPEVKVTSSNSAYRVAIAAQGNNLYVVWMDFRRNVWDIYARRSTDKGRTFFPEQKIATGTSRFGAERPDILIKGGSVFVAYNDDLGVRNCPSVLNKGICSEVYITRSDDNGMTWNKPVRVTYNNVWSGRPMLAATPTSLIVGWEQTISLTNTRNNIWINQSPDDGETWGTPQMLSKTPGSHELIEARNQKIWVAWHGTGAVSNQKIFVRESPDGGKTWNPEVVISARSGGNQVPVLALGSNYLQSVWYANGNPNYARRLIAEDVTPPVVTPPPVKPPPPPVVTPPIKPPSPHHIVTPPPGPPHS